MNLAPHNKNEVERRTVIGKALSAPLVTMGVALTAANIGLLPFQSTICKFFSSLWNVSLDLLSLSLFIPRQTP